MSANAVRRGELAEILDRLESGRTDGMDFDKARALLTAAMRNPSVLPLGAVLGTVIGGAPVKASTLFDEADPDVWANPVSRPDVYARPVPAKGRQGWWRFDPPEGVVI